MSGLKGKIVIVTGASSGIGLATATSLLTAGCLVFGVDISPSPPSLPGESFKFLQINIAETTAPAQIVEQCKTAFGGRIDALLNIAGIMDNFSSVEKVTDEDWDKIIAINLTAPVRLMREVVQVMKAQKYGNIINMSSKAGVSGAAAGLAYTSSKHGLLGATKNTAWLLKDDGIRCNAICPGGVATGIGMHKELDMESVAKIMPVTQLILDVKTRKGLLQPSAITGAIEFLLSDASMGVNGAIIPIDNGWSVL